MKTTIFLIAGLFASLSVFSKVHTVSNNLNSPGHFTSLQDALDTASANDTIYIHASAQNYGTVKLTKQLHLVGAGSMPDKQTRFNSEIYSLTLQFNSTNTSNASGSTITGLEITSLHVNGQNSTSAISNINISRCKIGYLYGSSNYSKNFSIRNSVFSSITLWHASNIILSNNIFNTIDILNSEGYILFTNNLCLNTTHRLSNVIASNNIFWLSTNNLNATNVENSTFTNNIFLTRSLGTLDEKRIDEATLLQQSNTGSGNFFNVNPEFEHYDFSKTDVEDYSYTSPTTGPFVNFRLKANSPGKGAGTDGTDIGIYGGQQPFVEGSEGRFRYFPLPEFPHVTDVNIKNATVLPNGTLHFSFKAKVQN